MNEWTNKRMNERMNRRETNFRLDERRDICRKQREMGRGLIKSGHLRRAYSRCAWCTGDHWGSVFHFLSRREGVRKDRRHERVYCVNI